MSSDDTLSRTFTEFFTDVEPRLRVTLVAVFGVEDGREATAEALAWGWEHWEELRDMENPVGYLYRVGRSRGRRLHRRPPTLPALSPQHTPWVEPGLVKALAHLSERQRVVVILVHSLGWQQTEVAEVLGVSVGTVSTHLERALRRLRDELGVAT